MKAKKKVPKDSHVMPNGKVMKNSAMKKKTPAKKTMKIRSNY